MFFIWRHPFAAGGPLLSGWWGDALLQICSTSWIAWGRGQCFVSCVNYSCKTHHRFPWLNLLQRASSAQWGRVFLGQRLDMLGWSITSHYLCCHTVWPEVRGYGFRGKIPRPRPLFWNMFTGQHLPESFRRIFPACLECMTFWLLNDWRQILRGHLRSGQGHAISWITTAFSTVLIALFFSFSGTLLLRFYSFNSFYYHIWFIQLKLHTKPLTVHL